MYDTIRWASRRRRLPRYGFHFTWGNLLFLAGTGMIGFAGVNADINLLMALFGLCLGAIMVSVFWGWFTLRGITVSRVTPDVLLARQSFVIRYSLESRHRWWAARGIHVVDILSADAPMAQPEAFVSYLPPGETITLHVPAICHARGRVQFTQIGVATRFPFGLFTKYLGIDQPHELTVFPELGTLQHDVTGTSRLGEVAVGDGGVSRRAGDDEYFGLREYRAGDNPRRIHWRRTAALGQLMVREMSRNEAQQVWVIVDTHIDEPGSPVADRLEIAISGAATVICDLLERGAKVGLVCNGEPLLVLPPGGGRAHRPRLLRELALRGTHLEDDLAHHVRRLAWPGRWRGPCLVFAASGGKGLEAATAALSRALGTTYAYVPGSPAFDKLIALAGRDRRARGPGEPRSSRRRAHAALHAGGA